LNIQVKKERKKVWSNRKKYAFFAPAFRKGGSVQPVVKRGSSEPEYSGLAGPGAEKKILGSIWKAGKKGFIFAATFLAKSGR
jgi:hypothetical protein